MYSLHTAQCVLLLSGHTADVTAVLCHPRNALQVYSTGLDGTVQLWDLYSGTCIRSWSVGQPILSAVISRNFSAAAVLNATASAASLQAGHDTLYLNCNPRTTSSSTSHTHSRPLIQRSCRIYAFHLPTATRTLLYKARHCTALALSPAQDYLASIAKHTLILYSLRTAQKCRFQHNNNLTSLAFHPRDSYVVTGDATGRIILWHQCFPFPAASTSTAAATATAVTAQPVSSILHWHSHAVAATAFTHDGAYLLSGGEEGVMVAWQMETGHKQFIPRLLSSIRSIVVSASNLQYALMHADNAIRIVSAVSSRVSRSIQGMEIGERRRKREGEERVQPVLVAAEAAGGVLMGGRSGYVQVWDVWTDVHVCDVDVTERNYVSRMDETLLHLYRVEHVSVTSDWMLTVERRTDAELRHKQALKFFRHSSQAAAASATTAAPGSPYILNTRIDQPHKQSITATAFHPSLPIAVTASADRTFKVWQTAVSGSVVTGKSDSKSDKTYWFCAAEGFYRDFPIHAASFSRDGLLAVSYGQLITVWSLKSEGGVVDGLELRRVLVHGSPMLPVLHMCWLGEGGRIATASADSVSVWDVRTGQCDWSWRLKVTSMCCDERGLMALCVSSTKPKAEDEQDTEHKEEEKTEENEEKEQKEAADDVKEVQPDDLEAAKKTQARGLFDSQLSHLLLFHPHSSTPFRAWRLDDLRLHRYQQSTSLFTSTVCFVRGPAPLQHMSSSLLYLNKRKQLVRLDDVESDRYERATELQTGASQPNTSLLSAAITTPVSLFERMYGKAALLPPPASLESQEQQPTAVELVVGDGGKGRRFEALFSTTSHALPAMSTLFTPFIQSILHQQPPDSEQQADQQQPLMDVDTEKQRDTKQSDATSGASETSPLNEDDEILRSELTNNPFDGLIALMTAGGSSDQPMNVEQPSSAAPQVEVNDGSEKQAANGATQKRPIIKGARTHQMNGNHPRAASAAVVEEMESRSAVKAKPMNGHAKLNGRAKASRGDDDNNDGEEEEEEQEEAQQNGVMEDVEEELLDKRQGSKGRRKTLPSNGGDDNRRVDGRKVVRRASMAVSKSKRTKA